jgi:two-component system osmolarity sensor histidine kinase EnvZ
MFPTEATSAEAPAPIPGATREIEAIETAFQDLLNRLERHERERALLLAGVSHDLRSPLARARMAADLLPEAPGVAQRREAILRNIDVADRLIGSFMDHVRASSLPLDERVDLAELCRFVVAAQARSEADGADAPASLSLEAPPSLVLPAANALLLERVLRNLIDNAFVHGQPPVTVRLWQASSGAVVLEVADRGPGIPSADQARLLQAFARGDASRNRPGTGLGLSVVDQVTTRLDGQVRMAHEDGWNRIQLWLPGPGAGPDSSA